MLLSIDGLICGYGHKTVLHSWNMEVPERSLTAVIGPSGCGKSTLLKTVGGFIRPQSGRIVLAGTDITELAPEKRAVATVFQNYALFPHMTVLENVMYGLRFCRGCDRNAAHSRAAEMLDIVQMTAFAGRKVTELSGGQQQRVALARALAVKPRLLLLDEPLSNIDVMLRRSLREEIREIQCAVGITVLLVTHDQEEALSISDQVIVAADGKIVQTGRPDEIYEHPAGEFVASFVGRINKIRICDSFRMVRPERLFPAENGAIRATVVKRSYYGAYSTYYLQMADGGRLQMDINSKYDRNWPIGCSLNLDVI